MKKYAYTTREARLHLAELLEAARNGEDVRITSRDRATVRLVVEQPSPLAAFRAWKAEAVELGDDPLENVRDSAPARKVRL